MAANNRYTSKKTISFRFSDKHKEYIRQCERCMFNVAEACWQDGRQYLRFCP